MADNQRKAGNFDHPDLARAYHEGRPGYAQQAIRFATHRSLRRPAAGRQRLVVNHGAGTGIEAVQAAADGHLVIAVEPAAEMRKFIPPGENLQVRAGYAEDNLFEPDELDSVLVMSAAHYFPDEAIHESIPRSLRSGGFLGLGWSYADKRFTTPWIDEFERLVNEAVGGSPMAKNRLTAKADKGEPLDLGPAFHRQHVLRFHNTQRLGRYGLQTFAASRSDVHSLPDGERKELLAKISEIDKKRHAAGNNTRAWYTHVYNAVRR